MPQDDTRLSAQDAAAGVEQVLEPSLSSRTIAFSRALSQQDAYHVDRGNVAVDDGAETAR